MASELGREAALAESNQQFHDAYARSLDAQKPRPVLVLLNNELILRKGASRHGFKLEGTEFVGAKIAAHLSVATFLLANDRTRLAATLARIEEMLESADGAKNTALRAEMTALLETSRDFAARALKQAQVDDHEREAFAASARDSLLRLTDLATEAELTALHAAAQTALASLEGLELEQLEVVVAGNHQARSRSLGMQYFARRLHEREGEETRVVYGENIETEDEALELVATRGLDRELARAFFGDERRMQRDLLADSATRCLDRMKVEESATQGERGEPRRG